MIEAIVAISLVVVGLIGVFGLLSSSTNKNKDVVQRVEATYIAAEGVEIVKSIIDTNIAFGHEWNAGLADNKYEVSWNTSGVEGMPFESSPKMMAIGSDSTAPLLLENGFYTYYGGSETPYLRTVTIDSDGGMRVNSVVKWFVDGEEKFVDIEDIFTSWREKVEITPP